MNNIPNSDPKQYSGSECAKLVGVDESTIRQWREKFHLPSVKQSNKRLFSQSILEVMLQIQALRKADPKVSEDTIWLNIRESVQAETTRIRAEIGENPGNTDSVQFGYEGALQKMQTQLSTELQAHTQALAHEFTQKIENQQVLAQAFGAAREELGALKAENLFLRQALHEEKQKTLLLPAPEDLAKTQTERDHLAQTLAEKEAALAAEAARLQALEAEKNRIVSDLHAKDQALAVQRSEADLMRAQLEASEALANRLQAEKEALLQAQGELSSELAQERKRSWWEKLFKK